MKKRVLFVCTGNSCRSVMAEALFKKMTQNSGLDLVIQSAGISALDGYGASPETLQVLQDEEGIDFSDHRSCRLTTEMVQTSDYIYVMEEAHRQIIVKQIPQSTHKVKKLIDMAPQVKERTGLSEIPDPIRMTDGFYRNVLEMIRECLGTVVKEVSQTKV